MHEITPKGSDGEMTPVSINGLRIPRVLRGVEWPEGLEDKEIQQRIDDLYRLMQALRMDDIHWPGKNSGGSRPPLEQIEAHVLSIARSKGKLIDGVVKKNIPKIE